MCIVLSSVLDTVDVQYGVISVAIWQEDGGVEEMERAGEKGGDDLDDDEEEEVMVQEYHSEDEGAPEKE